MLLLLATGLCVQAEAGLIDLGSAAMPIQGNPLLYLILFLLAFLLPSSSVMRVQWKHRNQTVRVPAHLSDIFMKMGIIPVAT